MNDLSKLLLQMIFFFLFIPIAFGIILTIVNVNRFAIWLIILVYYMLIFLLFLFILRKTNLREDQIKKISLLKDNYFRSIKIIWLVSFAIYAFSGISPYISFCCLIEHAHVLGWILGFSLITYWIGFYPIIISYVFLYKKRINKSIKMASGGNILLFINLFYVVFYVANPPYICHAIGLGSGFYMGFISWIIFSCLTIILLKYKEIFTLKSDQISDKRERFVKRMFEIKNPDNTIDLISKLDVGLGIIYLIIGLICSVYILVSFAFRRFRSILNIYMLPFLTLGIIIFIIGFLKIWNYFLIDNRKFF
ncbi:MAG: hypothetical protein EU535_07245, partial [Promethearchaeota archaeon]